MTITKQEHEKRKERVLMVAFELFVKDSIEAVSMQNIADEAKVGVASVFRYYANKTDLVIAVSAYKWHECLGKIETGRPLDSITDIPAVKRLEFGLDTYIGLYKNNKKLLKFNDNFNHYILHENVELERLSTYVAVTNPMRERFRMLYEKAKEDHTLRTDMPEDVFFRSTAHSMMAACHHYAGGFVWGADEDKAHDYTPELLVLKEMIMKYACEGIEM